MTSLPGPLVSGHWLAAHRADVHVIDVRWYLDGRSGRRAHDHGHIPGAVWLDVDTDLSEPAGPALGRHPRPNPERFAAALGGAGVPTGAPVVAYDDAGGSVAARLWWLLHVLGEPAAVLDGGIDAWPGERETGPVSAAPVPRAAVPWPAARFASIDEVAALRTGSVLVDARSAERYAGLSAPGLDPRPGHIPGALSHPWAANLDDTGRMRDADALRRIFADTAGDRVVAYCGSGVTACHDLLALSITGREDTALYDGSWSQWAADPDRPVATG